MDEQDELLAELQKATNPVVIQVEETSSSSENGTKEDHSSDFSDENWKEEHQAFQFGDMIDPEETADMAIHILDVVNTEVNSFLGAFAFFDARDKAAAQNIRMKMTENPNININDLSDTEREFQMRFNEFQELKEGIAFSDKTKANLRKPVVKMLEQFKWMRFTPAQATLFVMAMNNLPFMMKVLPAAFKKIKNHFNDKANEPKS